MPSQFWITSLVWKVVPSFAVNAEHIDSAIAKLAAYQGSRGGSSDPADYECDIDEGNITVLFPTPVD